MTKLEDQIALPLRQLIHPVQLGLGAAITCTGITLALGHLACAL